MTLRYVPDRNDDRYLHREGRLRQHHGSRLVGRRHPGGARERPPPPPPPPPDRTPPGNVAGVKVSAAGGQIVLAWTRTVRLRLRSRHDRPWRRGGRLIDPGLLRERHDVRRLGRQDRHRIPVRDHRLRRRRQLLGRRRAAREEGGRHSPGPAGGSSRQEGPGARVGAGRGTTYYNVQLFRAGHKILSLWPQTTTCNCREVEVRRAQVLAQPWSRIPGTSGRASAHARQNTTDRCSARAPSRWDESTPRIRPASPYGVRRPAPRPCDLHARHDRARRRPAADHDGRRDRRDPGDRTAAGSGPIVHPAAGEGEADHDASPGDAEPRCAQDDSVVASHHSRLDADDRSFADSHSACGDAPHVGRRARPREAPGGGSGSGAAQARGRPPREAEDAQGPDGDDDRPDPKCGRAGPAAARRGAANGRRGNARLVRRHPPDSLLGRRRGPARDSRRVRAPAPACPCEGLGGCDGGSELGGCGRGASLRAASAAGRRASRGSRRRGASGSERAGSGTRIRGAAPGRARGGALRDHGLARIRQVALLRSPCRGWRRDRSHRVEPVSRSRRAAPSPPPRRSSPIQRWSPGWRRMAGYSPTAESSGSSAFSSAGRATPRS